MIGQTNRQTNRNYNLIYHLIHGKQMVGLEMRLESGEQFAGRDY